MPRDPAKVAERWVRGMTSAAEKMKEGAMAVTVNPAERAIARQDAYIDGVQRAVTSGKWARGLRRTSLQSWQQAFSEKGVPRVTTGAANARPKFQEFMSRFLPHIDQLKNKLASMPRGSRDQNIARLLAAVEHNASFRS